MEAEVASLPLAAYMEWVASQKEHWDKYAIETTAEERGREEGKEEERHTIAKAMKAKGIAIDVISETTGLSADDINKL